jgi:hypothetical protein
MSICRHRILRPWGKHEARKLGFRLYCSPVRYPSQLLAERKSAAGDKLGHYNRNLLKTK